MVMGSAVAPFSSVVVGGAERAKKNGADPQSDGEPSHCISQGRLAANALSEALAAIGQSGAEGDRPLPARPHPGLPPCSHITVEL